MTVMEKPTATQPDWLPLNHAQRAVWLDARLIDDRSAYQVGCLVDFDGEIDPDVARQAVRVMMGRHDGLRLRVDADEPRQRIEPAGRAPFTLVDLSQEAEPETAAAEHVRTAQRDGFALGEEPLFRVDLMRLGPRRWRLMLLAHHLIADGVSIGLVQLYWLRAYISLAGEDEEGGDAAAMPRSSFLPVVADDEAYAASPRFRDDLSYWTERLSPPPGLLFETRPRPEVIDDRPEPIAPLVLDADAFAALEAQARAAGTTHHRALLGLIAVALSRRYRRSDFAIGMALHRRDATNRATVGMLAGMVAMRCRVDADMTLRRTVEQLASGFDADLRHQRMPVDALGRSLAQTGAFEGRADRGLFDVAVTMMPAVRDDRPSIGGRPVRSTPLRNRERTPLALYVDEKPDRGGLSIGFGHDPGRLSAAEVGRFRACLAGIVEDFAAGADRRLSLVDGLCDYERAALDRWSRGTTMTIPQGTLPDLFEAVAAAQPDATAVVAEDVELSFGQLDAAANRLAARLVDSGAEPGAAVGVCLSRSAASIVALLGVLKAGCVYLPLDPAYPPDRLAGMIADAGARHIVASDGTRDRVPADATILDLDEDRAGDDSPAAAPARPLPVADARAYVIYTSGSTGRPKGVAVSHRALINLAWARREHDPIGRGDRVLAAISVGFDVSLGQLLTPLLAGATVVVAGDIRGISGTAFWNLLADRGVTHVNSVPSFFESILADAPPQTPLKQLMLGGEPLSGTLATRLRDRLGVPVYNMYGPTEACIDATAFRFPDRGMERVPVLPIGRLLPNYTAFVLDEALRPVGIGSEGELCVGGDGLAEGYLNMPDATFDRFVDHPRLGRLYRTGDRASWREDGALAFHGRSDGQVKIRGFRVELGEIEAALREHRALAQVAVVARKDRAGEARLLAYAVPAAGAQVPIPDEIRTALEQRLPAHMVPATVTLLPALPTTVNGKLDERALPDPDMPDGAGEAPRTQTEKLLAGLFAATLGIEPGSVTTSSHFFRLGGHSLLATQLASRLREALQVELPIRTLFEAPRLGDLAARVEALANGSAPGPLADAIPAVADRPARIPLSFEQDGLWFLDRLAPGSAAYAIAIALRLEGPLDVEALRTAFTAVAARHESLRTVFREVDGMPEQCVLGGDFAVPFTVEAIGEDPGQALAEAAAEAQRPFDLARGPLIRVRLLRRAADSHVALVTLHHIVADGWSAGILLADLSAAYAAARAGGPPSLPALPIQYADYALWQRARLDDATVGREIAFWRATLDGAPDALALPFDVAHPGAARSAAGGSVPLALSPDLSRRIDTFARASDATPFMVLCAAWAALMGRWTGQDDIVLGAPVANRARPGTEAMIGYLVNTVALRADLSGNPGFATLLGRMRGRALDAYAHADLPFGMVVDALNPVRAPGRQPLFQTMVALQPAMPARLALGDVVATPLDLPEQAAKFDLTLTLAETADGLAGAITYASDLFAPDTVARLAAWLGRLLEAAIADPQAPLDRLPLTSAAERDRVEALAAGPALPVAIDTIPALFARQAAATPDTEAVRHGTVSLSFAELDARAERLARRLAALGIAPSSPVAVVLPRSEALVVAALAVLKAGCIYMPVDPAHPAERISALLARAAPAAAIIAGPTETLAAGPWPLIDVDEDGLAFSDAMPMPPPVPGDIAYIIHTSGSTGEPKGVAVSHAALANLAGARLAHDPIGPGDRVLATLSVSFDVSVGQLVTPLLAGATVVVAGDVSRLSAEAFWGLMATQRITHLNAGPAFLDAVLEAAPPPGLPLKRLMLGGEPFPTALARRIRAALPDTEIFNMYGPTEACIDATCQRFDGTETAPTLPIGRPLPNYRVLVVDAALEHVPPGIPGQIVIGGPSLADGYAGRPEETAERFIEHPRLGRLYRTGDLARLRPDGAIAFLGRADGQVKIRGVRIETGEIAAILRAHEDVQAAAVIARSHGGQTRLIAYVVPAGDAVSDDAGHTALMAALRVHLERRLPAAMVPAAILALDALPMTVNGKIDERALPDPEPMTGDDTSTTPPRDGLDADLLAIWALLLGHDRIGIDTNFFAAGGHSLQALRLAAIVRARLGFDIPIATLYENQSVRTLADAVRRGENAGPLLRLGGQGPRRLFCVHPAGGSALGYAALAEAIGDRWTVFGLQASGLDAGSAPATSLETMAADYVAAIRAEQPHGPYALLGHSFGGLVAFEMARQLEADGETVDRLTLLDTSWPAAQDGSLDPVVAAGAVMLREQAAAGLPPDALDGAQIARIEAVISNAIRLAGAYAPQPLRAPILYIAAERDTDDGRAALWSALSMSPALPAAMLPCDHFAMLGPATMDRLAALVRGAGPTAPAAAAIRT